MVFIKIKEIKSQMHISIDFDDFEEEKDIKSIEPIKADVEPEIYKTESESQLPVKLKIVGKIDLSTIRKK